MSFLEKVFLTVEKDGQASVLVKCAIGSLYLEQKNMKGLRALLDETRERLEGVFGAEAIVNASFFLLSSNYHKVPESPISMSSLD